MGALTSNRKRSDEFLSLNHGNFSPNFQSSSKRPRLSSMQKSGNPDRAVLSSKSAVAKVSRYPEAKTLLPRVHAPCRTLKFGYNLAVSLRDSSPQRHKKEGHGNAMGNFLVSKYYKAKNCALEACRFLHKEKEVIELDKDVDEEKTVSEDSSIEEVEVIEDDEPENARAFVPNSKELDAQALDCSNQPSSSSAASDLLNADQKVENLSLGAERDISSVSVYKKLLSIVDKRTSRLEDLNYEIVLNEKRRSAIQSLRPKKEPVEEVPREPFIPLTEEEEAEVKRALSVNGRKVLVAHENSNIEITGQLLQCLRPGAWLNDEVINVYLELLKEREKKDPKKFLKCHFFNTFFYKKLVSGNGYDYKSVRRWTTQRKLGYGLIECDKIFVPVHKEIHWCLAVINKKEEKFQYLDSLKGRDSQVFKVLPRYYVDEVKDKSGKVIDVSSWKHEFVEDLPEQENGFDCGVFMIKYADFYSRGLGLCFSQEHMPYFRLRTAKEILRLRAD